MTYQLRPVAYYRRTFDGSRGLFDLCWRQYRAFLRGDIDNPTCDDDVIDWLDHRAGAVLRRVRSSDGLPDREDWRLRENGGRGNSH